MAYSDFVLCAGGDGLPVVLPHSHPVGQHVHRSERAIPRKPVSLPHDNQVYHDVQITDSQGKRLWRVLAIRRRHLDRRWRSPLCTSPTISRS